MILLDKVFGAIMNLAASTGEGEGVVHPLIAGGSIRVVGPPPQVPTEPLQVPVLDAADNEIATIITFGDYSKVVVKFSDGKEATIQPKGLQILVSSTEFGDLESKTTWECGLQLNDKDGKCIIYFAPIRRLWVFPFLIITFCLGALCTSCMIRGPTAHLKKGDTYTQVGEVYSRYSCDCCNDDDAKPPKGSWIQVKSEDPAALRASVLMMAGMYLYYPTA